MALQPITQALRNAVGIGGRPNSKHQVFRVGLECERLPCPPCNGFPLNLHRPDLHDISRLSIGRAALSLYRDRAYQQCEDQGDHALVRAATTLHKPRRRVTRDWSTQGHLK
ncbi:hypothetical protein SDC9_212568 [bioreactor metagenome]|uniref:Uncharacterized protein n=1 Tax=bioreactor metagenome TaxID=1076179 RepID=A0A645JME2_9ZZZZ